MKKYDLCVRMNYTDKNGDTKTTWENIGMMMEKSVSLVSGSSSSIVPLFQASEIFSIASELFSASTMKLCVSVRMIATLNLVMIRTVSEQS